MAPTKAILAGMLISSFASAQTPTTTARPSNVQTLWGLCGGLAAFPTPFTRTLCEPTATCNRPNSFYWQCIPATATGTKTSSSKTTAYLPPTTTPFTTTTASRLAFKYEQCGGVAFPGPYVCSPGLTCSTANPYFAQCL